MCGIFALISWASGKHPATCTAVARHCAKLGSNVHVSHEEILYDVSTTIKSRGNDYYGEKSFIREGLRLDMGAAVLHMQGATVTFQPVAKSHGVLLWNGEIFGGEIDVPVFSSDTIVIANLLESFPDTDEFLVSLYTLLLSKIQGPYAFIYFRKRTNKIYYCRDVFGRRSLLKFATENHFLLCSALVPSESALGKSNPSNTGNYSLLGNPVEVDVNFIYEFDITTRVEKSIPRPAPFRLSIANVVTSSTDLYDKKLLHLLNKSIKKRVTYDAGGGKFIAILFSGGLDSTLVTRVADLLLESAIGIELLTVSFLVGDADRGAVSGALNRKKYPSGELTSTADKGPPNNTPDMTSAMASFEELQRLSPKRNWIFTPIEVTPDAYRRGRSRILSLIAPSDTAMDLSIAAPFWFASTWNSESRILLVGFGADELFGGYSRYRTRFENEGAGGLVAEMNLDLDRMWYRNLGRDDRVLSDGGREPRYPFLDEELVNFTVNECPLQVKMDLSLPRGIGEKAMLRRIAASLGLSYCTTLPKRAVQFGSHSARMEGPSIKSGRDPIIRDC